VSLHPNCKKRLKKVPRESAEYNLQTCVPKTRVNKTKRRIPGEELRVHHVLPRGPHNIQGTFREHSGNIQGTFWEHERNIEGTFREHSGTIQVTCTM
jgi:hypothetical protein